MIEVNFRAPGFELNLRSTMAALPRAGEFVALNLGVPPTSHIYKVKNVFYDFREDPARIYVELEDEG